MIKTIIKTSKRKEFDGAEIFGKINKDLEMFALAIHKTISTKYPSAFEMTNEEYEEIDTELKLWLETDEAQEINRQFQLESLSDILIETINAMHSLEEDYQKIENTIFDILEKEDEKPESKK